MAYLFVDTTLGQTIGLLNDSFEWLEYELDESTKSSTHLHTKIHDMLNKRDLAIDKDVDGIFFAAGPGSYTGMRSSAGLDQILSWQNVKTYSFYHFEVPYITGIDKGSWCCNAFKGEFFLYEWDGSEVSKKLMPKEDVLEYMSASPENGFSHGAIGEMATTQGLIHEHPGKLFTYLRENNVNKKPYYFRTLEEEFKATFNG
jgi:tRNA A37 threonylcarbamoyladenosine modification protein TsaB